MSGVDRGSNSLPVPGDRIRIGMLHSLSGTMGVSERPLLAIERFIIDEINAAGGVLGRRVEPVVLDGASSAERFAEGAQALIDQGVDNIFGCWTSASRKAVKPVVEAGGALLWYPVQYEGLEASANIVYTGACLNQQVTPALEWALEALGPRVFLVGSDYVFPRTANVLIRGLVAEAGGAAKIVGERYIPLGAEPEGSLIEAIREAQPDVIFNTVNGDGNVALFRSLQAAGIDPEACPLLSVSASENEAKAGGEAAIGHYACWNWFQTVDTPANQAFMASFRERFGEGAVCSSAMVQALSQIRLWKAAVEQAGSFEAAAVRDALIGLTVESPGGALSVRDNHHVDLPAYVGRAVQGGNFEIVWRSEGTIAPLPWLGMENKELDSATGLALRALAAFPDALHMGSELERVNRLVVQQNQEIQELRAPVIEIWRGVVLIPLIGAMDRTLANAMVARLLDHIGRTGTQVVLIDVTSVREIDAEMARYLFDTLRATRLMGAQAILTGVTSAVAIALVEQDIDLSDFATCRSSAEGLSLALKLLDGVSPR